MPTKDKRPKIPKFATEAEEAAWWHANRGMLAREMKAAFDDQSAHHGGPKAVLEERRRTQKNITIRMPEADLERAKRQAERKGLGYQTYMKMLLHQALEQEEKRT